MSERGSSLVESLVALVIIQLGLLAVAPLFVMGTRVMAGAGTMGTVGAAAVARMERLRALPFADPSLAAGSHTDNTVPDVAVTWTVTDDANPVYFKRITVTARSRRDPMGLQKVITLHGERAK